MRRERSASALEDDLTWFFTFAEGDLGMKSSHMTIVAMIESGPSATKTASSESAEAKMVPTFGAAARYRRVGGAIGTMPVTMQRVLQGAFTRSPVANKFRMRHPRLVHAACGAGAVREHLRGRWSTAAAVDLLVRCEGSSEPPMVALRVAAWLEAEARVDAAVLAYGRAAGRRAA